MGCASTARRLMRRRTPTVAFTVAGFSSTEVAQRLAERGVFASNGDFYAATVVERLGQARDRIGPRGLRLLHHQRRGGALDRWSPRHHPRLIPSGPIFDRSRPIFSSGFLLIVVHLPPCSTPIHATPCSLYPCIARVLAVRENRPPSSHP